MAITKSKKKIKNSKKKLPKKNNKSFTYSGKMMLQPGARGNMFSTGGTPTINSGGPSISK